MDQIVKSSPEQEEISALLRRHGINPTAQRLIIGRVVFSSFQHLSADQVLKTVNEEMNCVSKATVYNTLNLFAKHKLVHEVIVDPTKVFYDSNTSPHYHIYNEHTGELIDVGAGELEVIGIPNLPENTVAAGIDVIVRVTNRDHPVLN
ncbi:MAG: hypothetical protein A3J35_00725 [Gammaproteobacteria bacterium RIFCSPLOWO2_02_FULL_52_10]|nr:MAG: hypothetical protein A3J35_00725 [Gammaproteobacteria bacterium RIFCSPLOWO2_02_FULL_52_10]